MILIYLFFVPGILTLIDFIYYVATGEKKFDYVGGLLLDCIQLIGYPILFSLLFQNLGEMHMAVFSSPWTTLTILITVLSIFGYFAIRYAYPFINDTLTIIILVLLACGIFINVSMIHDGFSILSYFNIPIILLYLMQVATNVKRHIKN